MCIFCLSKIHSLGIKHFIKARLSYTVAHCFLDVYSLTQMLREKVVSMMNSCQMSGLPLDLNLPVEVVELPVGSTQGTDQSLVVPATLLRP